MDTLERIIRGEEKALEELLQGSWDSLVRYLMTLLPSRDQAKDAAQMAFVRIWAGRDGWKPGSARGLLFRLGRNAALDMIRKERVRSRWAKNRAQDAPDYAASPEDDAVASELSRRFRGALMELPDRRREVFELVRFRGFSYAEVARAMEISHQTVANQMTLAHRDLRRLLEDLVSEPAPESRTRGGRELRNG
jgi:RNA polymerase sigma-70 factor (ECF subfamily)